MSKGGGCVVSKNKEPVTNLDQNPPNPESNHHVSNQNRNGKAGTLKLVQDESR